MQFRHLITTLPQFEELLQEKQNNKLTHAYMFVSSDPVLLQEFSRMFASLVICESQNGVCGNCAPCQKIELGSHPDVVSLPQEEKVLVGDVEKLIDESLLVPMEANCKIYIFNNFSTANQQAQNKLLKTLETPPNNVYIILNVTNETNILPTITSRCKKIRLNTLKFEQVKMAIQPLCTIEHDVDTISYISEGSLTRALNFLNNDNFMQNYNLVCQVIKELKTSATVLPLSSSLNDKKAYFSDIVEIFESLFRDILMIRLNKPELVINKNVVDTLKQVAPEYSADAIDLIIKKLYQIKQQVNFNVNPTILIDNLLLYILEAKHLCK